MARKRIMTSRYTAECVLQHRLMIYPVPTTLPTNHITLMPPVQDHHHIIGFKSRGRAYCPAGARINHGNQWQNTKVMLPKSHLSAWKGACRATSHKTTTGNGAFSVKSLNCFRCDLLNWLFIAFLAAIKFSI